MSKLGIYWPALQTSIVFSFFWASQSACKRLDDQNLEAAYSYQNSVDDYDFIPPSAYGPVYEEVGFGLCGSASSTCGAGSSRETQPEASNAAGSSTSRTGRPAAASGSRPGAGSGTRTVASSTSTTAATGSTKPFDQWPGGQGTYTKVNDANGKPYYQAFDSTSGQWRTTRDESVAGKPFDSAGSTFAAWNGTNAGNDWRVTQYAQSHGQHTIFREFSPEENPYDPQKRNWKNIGEIKSQFTNQFNNVNAGNYDKLDPNFRYTRDLGQGRWGIPTGHQNQFALVNGRFDPNVRAGQFDAGRGVPIFDVSGGNPQLAGAYTFDGNSTFQNFNNWNTNFQRPVSIRDDFNNWNDVNALLQQMFRQ